MQKLLIFIKGLLKYKTFKGLNHTDDNKGVSQEPYNVDHIEVTKIIQGGLDPDRRMALKGKAH